MKDKIYITTYKIEAKWHLFYPEFNNYDMKWY